MPSHALARPCSTCSASWLSSAALGKDSILGRVQRVQACARGTAIHHILLQIVHRFRAKLYLHLKQRAEPFCKPQHSILYQNPMKLMMRSQKSARGIVWIDLETTCFIPFVFVCRASFFLSFFLSFSLSLSFPYILFQFYFIIISSPFAFFIFFTFFSLSSLLLSVCDTRTHRRHNWCHHAATSAAWHYKLTRSAFFSLNISYLKKDQTCKTSLDRHNELWLCRRPPI